MKRRDFLKTLSAVPTVIAVPALLSSRKAEFKTDYTHKTYSLGSPDYLTDPDKWYLKRKKERTYEKHIKAKHTANVFNRAFG